MGGMQQEEVRRGDVELGRSLARRFDNLRGDERRRGSWTASTEAIRPLADDSGVRPILKPIQHLLAEDPSNEAKLKAIVGLERDYIVDSIWYIVQLMDPEQSGTLSPDALVPLMFWLGLSRRRNAVLVAMEMGYGKGPIDVSLMMYNTQFGEVQVRLVEGLRRLARRESLDQLCEFTTDWNRINAWFYSMKVDINSKVDIVEVQNLFARMEVTTDRQALFRFLGFVARSNSTRMHSKMPTTDSTPFSFGRKNNKDYAQRSLSINDFAGMLCRCIVTWCLHRALVIVSPEKVVSRNIVPDIPGFTCVEADEQKVEVASRWTQLQRKIAISLLVNHRFWGRESRHVLASLVPPASAKTCTQLPPEKWLTLFQRVRAQGTASCLPVGDEVDDPDFLLKKASAAADETQYLLDDMEVKRKQLLHHHHHQVGAGHGHERLGADHGHDVLALSSKPRKSLLVGMQA